MSISGISVFNRFHPSGVTRICFILASLFLVANADAQKKDYSKAKIVVIDAGHGGKDPGTVVGSAREKNVVLDIALKLGNLIKNNQKNIKVVFTRDGDYYVPLLDRAQIANKINADLFISIHANYCGSPEVYGTETYVLGLHRTEDNLNVAKKENSVILLEDDYSTRYEGFNPNLSESYIMFELMQDAYLDQSLKFASILQTNFKELALRHDRDVRQAGFLVLRETSMPSVLIETGYLSNKKENSFLLTDNGRTEIAQSIYGSLLNYLNKVDNKENTVRLNLPKNLEDTNSSVKKTQTAREKPVPVVIKAEEKAKPNKSKPISQAKQKGEVALTKDTANKKGAVLDIESTFAIQIGAFSKHISPDSKAFKGISPIKELKADGKYKYFCYESQTFQAVKSNYQSVVAKFPDAFIVSIHNNQVRKVGDGRGKK